MHGPSSKSSSCHIGLGLAPAVATATLVDAAPEEAGVTGRTPRLGCGGVPSSPPLAWTCPPPGQSIPLRWADLSRPIEVAVDDGEKGGGRLAPAEALLRESPRTMGEGAVEEAEETGDIAARTGETSTERQPGDTSETSASGNASGLCRGHMPEGGFPEDAAEAAETEAGDASEASGPRRLPLGNPTGLRKG